MSDQLRCAQALNLALHEVFEECPDAFLIGEDLLDPYGGAFKVAAGLSSKWPERVLTTPISEAALTGIGAGMALRGMRPVVEIMFGDFITLAFDQIVNHIVKFPQISDGRAKCPIVIRVPMGGRRGYGPTHSQSLEKFLVGVPGLVVVAPSRFHDIRGLLKTAVIEDDRPVIFIENKVMYGQFNIRPIAGRIDDFMTQEVGDIYPTLILSANEFQSADATVVTYGGMVPVVMEAALELAIEHEIFVDIVAPSQLSPLRADDLLPSLRRSRRLVVAEEGAISWGWGAEVVAKLVEVAGFPLPVTRVAASDSIVPSSRALEDLVLPQPEDVRDAVRRVIEGDRIP